MDQPASQLPTSANVAADNPDDPDHPVRIEPLDRLDKVFTDAPRVPTHRPPPPRWKTTLLTAAISIAVAVAVLAVASTAAYLAAVYAIRNDERLKVERDREFARRDEVDAEQQAQIQAVLDEYRRQICAVTAALPQPPPDDIVYLRTVILDCDTVPARPPTQPSLGGPPSRPADSPSPAAPPR